MQRECEFKNFHIVFVIGIAGGSGSGKTALTYRLLNRKKSSGVAMLCQDYYYFDNSHLPLGERKKKNFDHPDAVDFSLMASHLNALRLGETIHHPLYSFHTCTRLAETETMRPPEILFVEGILIFTNPSLREVFDLKLFIDVPETIRLKRIIHRDVTERGRTKNEANEHFQLMVRPMHELFVEPSKVFADHILNGLFSLDLLCSQVENLFASFPGTNKNES